MTQMKVKNADVTYTVEEAEEVTEDVIEVNPFTGVVSVKESLVGLENKIFQLQSLRPEMEAYLFNQLLCASTGQSGPTGGHSASVTEPLYSFSASEDLLSDMR